MDIDYADVARGMANKLSAAVFEVEQWRAVADSLQRMNQKLTEELREARDGSSSEETVEGSD